MEPFKINFKYDIHSVAVFVNAAFECGFYIDVKYRHRVIDGKSLLGMIAANCGEDLEVSCRTDDADGVERFKSKIAEIIVA